MDYTRLGSTDLRVSRVCAGTVFRSEADEANCLAALDAAIDLGVNFIDCANVYRGGLSERIVGKALKRRRDRLVVTTKVGAPTGPDPASGGLGRGAILREADASLRRLDTDYIDLYLCHHPDPDTPLEETAAALDELVRAGKVRHAGCSNFEAWRLAEALCLSRQRGLAPWACDQVLYNLLDRRIEDELLPYCALRGVGVTVFAPTAIGLLTGRFRRGQPPPPDTPWRRGPYNYRTAMSERTGRVIETLLAVARDAGRTPAQVALAWCLSRPGVTSVITGIDAVEQARENAGAVGWMLHPEHRARLDEASEGGRLVIRKDCPVGF